MRLLWGRIIAALLLALVAAGCSTIPDSGPAHRIIEDGAAASLRNQMAAFSYVLVDLNQDNLPFVPDPSPGSFYHTFGTGYRPSPEIKVGIGDTVLVTLFEAQSGGLFIPSDAGARPGNFVSLPSQTVDSKGFITVPYAGQIRALDRSTPSIQQEITDKLKNKAIQPQAVVSLVTQTSTQVTVIGEVNAAGKISINPAGDRVLDAISRAGGIKDPGYETYVTLQRHGLKGTVFFPALVQDPQENIYVRPGDTLYVYQYQRVFVAFGAIGASGVNGTATSVQFKFLQAHVTLNDAIGKAGGLLDDRSDPREIFVYRLEEREALKKMGVDVSGFDPALRVIPTIYRVNFRDPSGYFVSQKFPVRDGDILYVDNADQVELSKFITAVTQVPQAGATVVSAVRVIRNP